MHIIQIVLEKILRRYSMCKLAKQLFGKTLLPTKITKLNSIHTNNV